MRLIRPASPAIPADDGERVATGTMSTAAGGRPAWTDVDWDPMQGLPRRLPWNAPVWNAGNGESEFVPGLVRKHVDVWD